MNKSPITLEEIKELEQIVSDLKAMQAIFSEHTKRVEAIVKKYSMPKSEAALKREQKRMQSKLDMERRFAVFRAKSDIKMKRGRIKYLKANPEPGSEQEIQRIEAALKAMGKLK